MKNLILKSSLLLGVAVMSAFAQDLTATIPFNFEANGKSLPAGDYSMVKLGQNGDASFVMRNVHTNQSTVVVGKAPIANSEGPEKLVFRSNGADYTLTELWDGRMGRTVACPRGKSSILAASRVVIAAHH